MVAILLLFMMTFMMNARYSKSLAETFEYCVVEAVDIIKYWNRLNKKEFLKDCQCH